MALFICICRGPTLLGDAIPMLLGGITEQDVMLVGKWEPNPLGIPVGIPPNPCISLVIPLIPFIPFGIPFVIPFGPGGCNCIWPGWRKIWLFMLGIPIIVLDVGSGTFIRTGCIICCVDWPGSPIIDVAVGKAICSPVWTLQSPVLPDAVFEQPTCLHRLPPPWAIHRPLPP